MRKRDGIRCPNCGRRVRYGSQHARGKTELDMVWTCKKKEIVKGQRPRQVIFDELGDNGGLR